MQHIYCISIATKIATYFIPLFAYAYCQSCLTYLCLQSPFTLKYYFLHTHVTENFFTIIKNLITLLFTLADFALIAIV